MVSCLVCVLIEIEREREREDSGGGRNTRSEHHRRDCRCRWQAGASQRCEETADTHAGSTEACEGNGRE